MAPLASVPNTSPHEGIHLDAVLLHDDVFQTSLDSEEYLESLAPIVKSALKANGLNELISKLNTTVKEKDAELNEVSLSSTQDINSCVDSIDRVNVDSTDLNKNLQKVSTFLSKSVNDVISRKKTLLKAKELTSKINETSLVLGLCIQVLEITNRIHDLIKQHKYFSALKLTDELTSIHLPKVENFSFSIKIYDSIPHLTKMIKDELFDNLCRWLSMLTEKRIRDIAGPLWDNLAQLQESWHHVRTNPKYPYLPHRLNSPIELSMREPALNHDITASENLKYLFDAILVYQTLNELPLLSSLYHKEWYKRYARVIYPITLAASSDKHIDLVAQFPLLEALADYLRKVSTFFVVDKQINLATKFLIRHNSASNDLWELYVIKLKPVLLHHLRSHKLDLEQLVEFKDIVGDFLQIMENNDYRPAELYEILVVVFQEYFCPGLIQNFRLEFIDSIQGDHYMPLVVNDKQDYASIMKVCWYRPDAFFAPNNVKKMPVSFPFSEDYVHYCLGVRNLLEDILDFTLQHYNTNLSELNTIIVNVFESVLGDQPGVGISHDIREFINKNLNNKEVIAQSYTNLEYYLFSLYEIGAFIDRRLRAANGIGIHNIDANGTFTLKAIDHFLKVRKFSEDAIFNMVDVKIRELSDMVEYDDWYPELRNREPNYSIRDFALFLDNLFTSIFSNLPQLFRTLGLFRTYDFVAEHFLGILKNAPGYNRIAIENFNLDIKHLEDSMGNLYSTQDTEGGNVALQSTFTELRQCIDLLLLENADDFLKNPSLRMRRFDRLKLEDGVALLAKLEGKDDEDADTSALSVDSGHSLKSSKFSFSTKFRN